MEQIESFASFQSLSYSNGTNCITLSADWERERIRYNNTKISRIKRVQSFLTFRDPIMELKDAMEMHEFFQSSGLFFYIIRVLRKADFNKVLQENKQACRG